MVRDVVRLREVLLIGARSISRTDDVSGGATATAAAGGVVSMSDERAMIDSEATTAGAVRQSGERCEQGPVLTEHEKEIRRDQAMKQLTQERDDLRRQLAQAEERERVALALGDRMRQVLE